MTRPAKHHQFDAMHSVFISLDRNVFFDSVVISSSHSSVQTPSLGLPSSLCFYLLPRQFYTHLPPPPWHRHPLPRLRSPEGLIPYFYVPLLEGIPPPAESSDCLSGLSCYDLKVSLGQMLEKHGALKVKSAIFFVSGFGDTYHLCRPRCFVFFLAFGFQWGEYWKADAIEMVGMKIPQMLVFGRMSSLCTPCLVMRSRRKAFCPLLHSLFQASYRGHLPRTIQYQSLHILGNERLTLSSRTSRL